MNPFVIKYFILNIFSLSLSFSKSLWNEQPSKNCLDKHVLSKLDQFLTYLRILKLIA
jgi:hypothetical protein